MSWNISIWKIIDGIDTKLLDLGNYTYNVCNMYQIKLNSGLNELNGMNCKDLIPKFKEIVDDMKLKPELYKKLNPKNGWGNYEGALDYISNIYKGCLLYPSGYLSVS